MKKKIPISLAARPRMRPARNRTLAFLASALLLVGIFFLNSCGAARPVKYFTLNPAPVPAHSLTVANDAPLDVALLVGHISASHLYLDDRIVYTSGSVEMGTYEYQRWASVPTVMIETMLTQKLRSEGKFRSVGLMSSNARGDYILRGHLYSLEEVDSPALAARFSIELELFQPKTGLVVWSQSYTHDQPVREKTLTAIVEALQQNVDAGLDQLTSGLDSYFSNHAR